MSLEKYNQTTADAFVRARLGGEHFIGPLHIWSFRAVNARVGRAIDLKDIDFLNGEVAKCSNNERGRVCTCDGKNIALRAYQVASEACSEILHNWRYYMAYKRTYGDNESYQIIWDAEDSSGPRLEEGLDDLCKQLGMSEVGTRGKFYYADYHYLRDAISSIQEGEEMRRESERDKDESEIDYWNNEVIYWEPTANQILSKYLTKFIEGAILAEYNGA